MDLEFGGDLDDLKKQHETMATYDEENLKEAEEKASAIKKQVADALHEINLVGCHICQYNTKDCIKKLVKHHVHRVLTRSMATADEVLIAIENIRNISPKLIDSFNKLSDDDINPDVLTWYFNANKSLASILGDSIDLYNKVSPENAEAMTLYCNICGDPSMEDGCEPHCIGGHSNDLVKVKEQMSDLMSEVRDIVANKDATDEEKEHVLKKVSELPSPLRESLMFALTLLPPSDNND